MVAKYDAWLHWNVTDKCNLECAYCFNRTSNKMNIEKIKNLGIKNIPLVAISRLREIIKKPLKEINIDALINTLGKTNKTYRIGLVGGGEPFLVPNIVEACVELTRFHYIAINSNLTSKKIKEFALIIDPERVVHFHASLHIKELERLHLMDRYIENFLLLRERGFDIFAQEVAYPNLSEEVIKYKKFFEGKGIELTFGPFCGEYKGLIYPDAYTQKEIENFGLKESDMVQLFYHKGEICNAGYNVGIVSNNGDIKPCHLIHKDIGNIYEEIKFMDKVIRCPFEFCYCPLKNFDNNLYKIALENAGKNNANKIFNK